MSKDKEKEPGDIALIYLQTFATPGGLEVLSDLKKNFGGAWHSAKQGTATVEEQNGANKVIEHIINKMRSVNKTAAAEVVFKADCL